jgi:hypothetical protein
MGSVTGTDDLVTSTVEADEVVTGVCIKSGANMFPPDTHSGVLDNGTYENDCYQVSGVGTQTVTVTRIGTPSSTCQAISHIDVVFEQAPPPETGTLLIEKACNGTDDGSIFTINVSGGIGPVELGCGDTSEALTVDADTEYTVSETPPAGWTGPQFSGDCASDGTITVEAEATATCTVTNTAGEPNTATATLLIMKECVGTDDGSTFTINVSGGIGPVELGCGDTSDPLTVDADTEYTVSETPPTGWTGPDIRGACDGDGTVTLDTGETGTCVVTNTAAENTATLLIMKECVGTDDGSTFTINVSGGIGSVALNCGETSDPLTINAGTQYTVSETPPTGWTGPDIRGACDGDGTVTLDAGETGTCVVTNTAEENTATLLIMKECVGTDDGSTFTINVSGGIGSVALDCGETSDPLTINASKQNTY